MYILGPNSLGPKSLIPWFYSLVSRGNIEYNEQNHLSFDFIQQLEDISYIISRLALRIHKSGEAEAVKWSYRHNLACG
jgi:hypothetical protein